jgi:hypothetical protein
MELAIGATVLRFMEGTLAEISPRFKVVTVDHSFSSTAQVNIASGSASTPNWLRLNSKIY